jgi:hypothetical protein
MARKGLKIKAGDVVQVHWDDASSPGRTFIPDAKLPMAELVSYGLVSHIDDRKLVIRQEEDRSVDAGENGHEMKEAVLIPIGCITKVILYRPVGDASL